MTFKMKTVVFILALLSSAPGCTPRKTETPINPLVAARPYRAVVPSQVNLQKAYPLIIVLHGLGHSGRDIERYYQLDPFVEPRGVLLAYPDGTRERPNRRSNWRSLHQRFWNATDVCCDFAGSGVDDVAYLDAVIDDISGKYRVDSKRIFIMGISNGGYMAYRFACDRAARVAAIVSQAGAMWTDVTRCKPSSPVAVLHIHGTADEMIPYGGGRTVGGNGPPVISAHQAVADWVKFDGCAPAPDVSAPAMDLISDESPPGPAETTVEKWTGCRGVELWTMHGAPHSPALNYPAWPTILLDWLMAHPKP
jgi:polyhydroxybutyrate depolymerase